ncbi:GLUG motif-containing protein [Clostridium sp. LBM24168]
MKLNKRISALLIIIAIFINIDNIPAMAAQNGKIIYINSVQDLVKLDKSCSLDTYSQGKIVYLKRDLDVSNSKFAAIPTFGGIFNGGGHTISGLKITKAGSVQGIFRYIQNNGKVINLNVSGTIQPSGSKQELGGIAGINYGEILNCSFSGSIVGSESVGGIAGVNERAGSIKGCRSSASITADRYTGGITGRNFGSVFYSTNKGKINAVYTQKRTPNTTVDSKNSNSDILPKLGVGTDASKNQTSETDTGDLLNEPGSYMDAGGIAGHSSGIIQYCKNSGEIGYPHVGYNVGGIAGRQNGYLTNSSNQGEIHGRKNIGGIVGQMEPNLSLQYSEDTFQKIGGHLQKISGLFDNLLDDVHGSSNSISNQITDTMGDIDSALETTNTLAHQTTDLISEGSESINNSSERITNSLAKSEQVFEQLENAADNMSVAAKNTADGFKGLQESSSEAGEAMLDLSDAFGKFENGADKLQDALDRVTEALDKLIVAPNEEEKEAALKDLQNVLASARSAAEEMNSALQNAAAALQKIREEDPKAYDELNEALANLSSGTTKLITAFSQISADLSAVIGNSLPSIDLDGFASGMASALESFNEAVDNVTEGFEKISDAFNEMYKASNDLGEGLGSFKDASNKLSSALADLSDASAKMEQIISELTEEPIIQLPVLDKSYSDHLDQLFDSLSEITSGIETINKLAAGAGKAVTNDLKAITAEMNNIGEELASSGEQKDDTNLFEDVSDEELANAKEGKVAFSENTGVVSGDVSAGGIAGSMSIFYEFDRENDILNPQTTGTKSLNFAYKTRAVIYQSHNRGNVTTKKNCAGGIAGEADLGTIYGCQNYGNIKSTDGNYAGGIAGSSLSTIRLSYALSDISGKSYVGGIAGSGENIENCYAFVRINSDGEHLGSIAGAGDGNITNNYFVGNQWNGIDGISYNGKVVPQEYGNFIMAKDMPTEFKNLKLRFLVDGKEIAVIPFHYGEAISTKMLPEIKPKSGYSAKWPDYDYSHLTFNETFQAKYDPLVAAIASKQTRGKPARPILLAESSFEKGAVINLSKVEMKNKMISTNDQSILESWKVAVNGLHNGNAKEIKFRYLAPETSGRIHIWVKKNSGWTEEAYKVDGSYLVFMMEPQSVFAVTMQPNIFLEYLAAWIVLTSLLIFMASLFLLYRRGKLISVQTYFKKLFGKIGKSP